MDGIQPYAGAAQPPAIAYPQGIPVAPIPVAIPPKTLSDYARSVRRRAWLVLTVGVLVSVPGTLLVLRMPAVYRTSAEITIEPPRYDQYLSRIITAGNLVQSDHDELEKFVPNQLQRLRSKSLVDKVVRDPSITGGQPISPLADPSAELIKNLYTKNTVGTSFFTISLEGSDPIKPTKTLTLLLEHFKERAREESQDVLKESERLASRQLDVVLKDIAAIHKEINEIVQKSNAIGPGGASLPKERLAMVQTNLMHKQLKLEDLQRTIRLDAARGPTPVVNSRSEAKAAKIARLVEERDMLEKRLSHARRNIRASHDDPYILGLWNDMKDKTRRINAIEAEPVGGVETASAIDDSEVILVQASEEIQDLKAEADRQMTAMQESMPMYDRYFRLVDERDIKQKQLADTLQKLSEFTALAATQKEPVKIVVPPVEPIMPDRPKRGMLIAGFIAFGFIMGMALACLIEHVDHSVKVPEHLTSGLSLPLLGVVPRIRRTAKLHRGGHLWTPGAPDSVEADAYRNIRASLVGLAGTRGTIVTLLVTSAKAGEGKSTTALNLAATCARAGERTLLVDVDLRRPSLADVFPHDDGHLGLVDVLRGDLPWQRVVVPTDLPNLDFLPTGDTRAVPIEILGSLELRQLLLSLSQHHYDRVILDGPAVLGLADCRMLGRIVDAAVMVVRSGTMELRPLRRAKAMLEQSQVPLAGVIFNGLADDLDNWSSYGPNPSQSAGMAPFRPRQAIDVDRDAPVAHAS